MIDVTASVALLYAVTVRRLRRTGKLIGTNDLWIGCTAKAAGLPIATRNAEHFRRIPDLVVLDYTRA